MFITDSPLNCCSVCRAPIDQLDRVYFDLIVAAAKRLNPQIIINAESDDHKLLKTARNLWFREGDRGEYIEGIRTEESWECAHCIFLTDDQVEEKRRWIAIREEYLQEIEFVDTHIDRLREIIDWFAPKF